MSSMRTAPMSGTSSRPSAVRRGGAGGGGGGGGGGGEGGADPQDVAVQPGQSRDQAPAPAAHRQRAVVGQRERDTPAVGCEEHLRVSHGGGVTGRPWRPSLKGGDCPFRNHAVAGPCRVSRALSPRLAKHRSVT